jgi:tripartite-type tricarboxylate transporter receptor subunit TctC
MHRLVLRCFLITLVALGVAGTALAQPFPNKPIKIVVPFAAGGTADPVARMLSELIGRKTGAKFIIESKPGAGGNIGNQAVATAEKDGYTVLLGANNNFVVNQFLFPQGSGEPLEAFSMISVLLDQPQVVYVKADFPANTLAELIDYIKARPGQINYASPGAGSAPHLAGEVLSEQFGLKMVHVPYKGGAPAVTALLSGEVQLYMASLSVGKGQVEAGKLKALATTSAVRLAALPNVPTTREAGAPDYRITNWWALAAPKGTPRAALEWIHKEFTLAQRDPEVGKRLEDLGFVVLGNTPEQFEERVKRESAMYQQLIKSRQISAQ